MSNKKLVECFVVVVVLLLFCFVLFFFPSAMKRRDLYLSFKNQKLYSENLGKGGNQPLSVDIRSEGRD